MKKAINMEKVIKANAEVERIERIKSNRWLVRANHTAEEEAARAAFNAAKASIDEAIKSVEGRASARTLTARKIILAIARLESELEIPKKAMVGIRATIDVNAQTFPNAYKYTPMSTVFDLERRASGWFVTDIRREECRRNKFRVTLTDDAKKAILDKYARF